MAKQIEANGLSGKDALDYVNSKAVSAQEQEDALLASLDQKAVMAKLDEVSKASKDKFKKADADFWKPTKPKEDFLKGIYLGSYPGKKYMVHLIGTKDSKGKPLPVRVNGTTILTRELKRGQVGQGVLITYMGEGKTDDGMKLTQMEVEWFE